MSFCICLPNFVVISRQAAELWRYIHYSKWRPAAILDLIWVMLDHPRSAIVGLSSILNHWSQLHPQIWSWSYLYSLRYYDFHILPFWLEIAYSRPLGGVGGILPPNVVTHCSNPWKDHPCAETRRLSHKVWKSVQWFDPGAR